MDAQAKDRYATTQFRLFGENQKGKKANNESTPQNTQVKTKNVNKANTQLPPIETPDQVTERLIQSGIGKKLNTSQE